MNRRVFLSALAAAPFLDPERLLWMPRQKTIFIPKPVCVVDTGWDSDAAEVTLWKLVRKEYVLLYRHPYSPNIEFRVDRDPEARYFKVMTTTTEPSCTVNFSVQMKEF